MWKLRKHVHTSTILIISLFIPQSDLHPVKVSFLHIIFRNVIGIGSRQKKADEERKKNNMLKRSAHTSLDIP